MNFSTIAAIRGAVVLGLLLAIGQAAAQDGASENNFIQGGHSGAWYNVAQPGHGLFVEVLDDETSPTGKEIFLAWFAFFNGRQVWLVGQGDVTRVGDGQMAEIDVDLFEGNDFPPDYDPDRTTARYWGELTLSFTGCELALLEWSSVIQGYGSGELDLRRLTSISGSRCDPDLGGEDKLDDHGDTWETGTFLTSLGSTTRRISGQLEERGDVDVFVFELAKPAAFVGYTLSSTALDTVGTLYRIVNFQEVSVTTDDNSGLDNGFLIERSLTAGSYSLHVVGKDGAKGPYDFYFKATPN